MRYRPIMRIRHILHLASNATYGGQAVIEGVMMRSPHYWAVAVRREDGQIALHEREWHSLLARKKWLRLPVLRGVIALGESMVIGFRALSFSSSQQLQGIGEKTVETEAAEASAGIGISGPVPAGDGESIGPVTMALILLVSVAMSIGLFKLLPALTTATIIDPSHTLPFVLLEGAVKISIFCVYTWALGLVSSGRSLYQYHAAEHKAINAMESGHDLSPESVNECSRIHVRCGTAFMLWMFVLGIIVFGLVGSLLGGLGLIGLIATRILLWPLLAGLGYEVIRFAGAHPESVALRTLLAPGLWLQRLTTKESDPGQCEVAMASLNRVRELEDAHLADDAEKEQEVLA
jgi:uncharacterized protein YqhQ